MERHQDTGTDHIREVICTCSPSRFFRVRLQPVDGTFPQDAGQAFPPWVRELREQSDFRQWANPSSRPW